MESLNRTLQILILLVLSVIAMQLFGIRGHFSEIRIGVESINTRLKAVTLEGPGPWDHPNGLPGFPGKK